MLRSHSLAAAMLLVTIGLCPTGASPAAPDDELPDGPGRRILLAACTSCHELAEVTKFKGYYHADDWRDIVVTMVKYGATLKEKEVEVLVDYLAKNLGPK